MAEIIAKPILTNLRILNTEHNRQKQPNLLLHNGITPL